MFELKKILVVIEPGAQSQPALARALMLARAGQAELALIIADYSSYLEDGYYFDPIKAQEMRREHGDKHLATLEQLAEPLRAEGLHVSCATAWGNPPYEQVIRHARDIKPDLLVKSTHRHDIMARLFLTNDDWELIRYCPTPLLLVKNQDWQAHPVYIAAVDPEHAHDKPASLDHKLLNIGSALAALTNGSIHLYHSNRLPALSDLYPAHGDFQRDLQKTQDLAAQYAVPASNSHVSTEDINHSLPALAEQLHASAVVMGAVSRSRMDRLLIGNTAERVLDKLACDVLVVKPDHQPPPAKILL